VTVTRIRTAPLPAVVLGLLFLGLPSAARLRAQAAPAPPPVSFDTASVKPTSGSDMRWISRSRTVLTCAALLVCAGAVRLPAQSTPSSGGPRRFEAASVKPNALTSDDFARAAANGSPLARGVRTSPGGRLTATWVTLKALILRAYELQDFQLEGGPKWLDSDHFDVAAVAGREATEAELNEMLRTLLAERFGLRTHTESRDGTVYVITVARSDGRLGPKLQRTSPECDKQQEAIKNGAPPPPPPKIAFSENPAPVCGMTILMTRSTGGAQTMLFGGQEISRIRNMVSNELRGPAVDRTGLTGRFDITVEYQSSRVVAGVRQGLDANGTDSAPLPLREAVQQQLGLQIDPQQGSFDVTIIDVVEQPQPD
jgi:uncharacterized protein (TIGR03435 family)